MSALAPSSSQLFLGRQPILDRNQHLVAYELLFRSGGQNAANFTNGVQATATVIANAFSELSIRDVLGTCRGFINVDEDFLFSDVLEILPRHSVVLEILETVPPTPEVIARCRELKALGFTLALDDVTQIGEAYVELVALVDIVKVDIQPLNEAEIRELAVRLNTLRKLALAEKVDTREQMEHCLNVGFSLFQGYYFAKPTVLEGTKLEHSQVALMKLMGLLVSDADTIELEAVFKREPGLAVNLLRLTNSVGAGMTVRITSLRHAISVLGRRQLKRWLQLLLFASSGDPVASSPLLTLAATRGRLMEAFAALLKPRDGDFSDQAFMTGIMSLMPVLVGRPMNEISGMLGVDPEVKNALCERQGILGHLLGLTEDLETNDPVVVEARLQALPLDIGTVNHCLAQAMTWANNLGQEQEHDL